MIEEKQNDLKPEIGLWYKINCPSWYNLVNVFFIFITYIVIFEMNKFFSTEFITNLIFWYGMSENDSSAGLGAVSINFKFLMHM